MALITVPGLKIEFTKNLRHLDFTDHRFYGEIKYFLFALPDMPILQFAFLLLELRFKGQLFPPLRFLFDQADIGLQNSFPVFNSNFFRIGGHKTFFDGTIPFIL